MSKAEVGLMLISRSGVGGRLGATGRPLLVEGVYWTVLLTFSVGPFFKIDLGAVLELLGLC